MLRRHWLLAPAFRHDSLRLIPEWIEEYGDIFSVRVPFGQLTVVASPELARQHEVLFATVSFEEFLSDFPVRRR